MTQTIACTNITDLKSIQQENLPMLVLSGNNQSFLNWAIQRRTKSHYAHMMWMHRPGFFATQDWWYREVPIEKYDGVRLKLWHNPKWRLWDKTKILLRIDDELKKPKWQTHYDLLAIIGQLLGITGIQTPWTNICSDWGALIKLIDDSYDLDHPDPGDINEWLKTHKNYECFTRYIPD